MIIFVTRLVSRIIEHLTPIFQSSNIFFFFLGGGGERKGGRRGASYTLGINFRLPPLHYEATSCEMRCSWQEGLLICSGLDSYDVLYLNSILNNKKNKTPCILTHYHTRYIAVENSVRKRRNCLVQAISPFLTMISTLYDTYISF